VKMAVYFHLVSRWRMLELCLHSLICLHGMTTVRLPYDGIQTGEMGRAFSMHGEKSSDRSTWREGGEVWTAFIRQFQKRTDHACLVWQFCAVSVVPDRASVAGCVCKGSRGRRVFVDYAMKK
jgi:hypothetical protein